MTTETTITERASRAETQLQVVMAEQTQMLARQRRNLGRLCAQGVPGAWQVLNAIYGQDTPRTKAVSDR